MLLQIMLSYHSPHNNNQPVMFLKPINAPGSDPFLLPSYCITLHYRLSPPGGAKRCTEHATVMPRLILHIESEARYTGRVYKRTLRMLEHPLSTILTLLKI